MHKWSHVQLDQKILDGLYYSRHGLKDSPSLAKGELVNYFLFSLAKIDFPSVLANSLRQLDIATVLIADIVEQILMETCILDVIGRHLAEKATIKFLCSFDKVCMHHQVRHNVNAVIFGTQPQQPPHQPLKVKLVVGLLRLNFANFDNRVMAKADLNHFMTFSEIASDDLKVASEVKSNCLLSKDN